MGEYFDEILVLFDEDLKKEKKTRQKEAEKRRREMETLRKKEEKLYLQDLKRLKSLKRVEEEKLHLDFEARHKKLQEKHATEIATLQKIESKLEKLQKRCFQLTKSTQTDTSRNKLSKKKVLSEQRNSIPASVAMDVSSVLEAQKIDLSNCKRVESVIKEIQEGREPSKSEVQFQAIEKRFDDILKRQIARPECSNNNVDSLSKDQDRSESCESKRSPDFNSFGNVKKSIEKWNSILDARSSMKSQDKSRSIEDKHINDPPQKANSEENSVFTRDFLAQNNYSNVNPIHISDSKNYIEPFTSTFIERKEDKLLKSRNNESSKLSNRSRRRRSTSFGSKECKVESKNNNNSMELTITCGCNVSTLKILTPKNSSLQLSQPDLNKLCSSNGSSCSDLSHTGSSVAPISRSTNSRYNKAREQRSKSVSRVSKHEDNNSLSSSSLNDSFQLLNLSQGTSYRKLHKETNHCKLKGSKLKFHQLNDLIYIRKGEDDYLSQGSQENELNSTFTLDEKAYPLC